MKPYSLSLYTDILDPGFFLRRQPDQRSPDWTRTISAIGGYLAGNSPSTPPD